MVRFEQDVIEPDRSYYAATCSRKHLGINFRVVHQRLVVLDALPNYISRYIRVREETFGFEEGHTDDHICLVGIFFSEAVICTTSEQQMFMAKRLRYNTICSP